MHINMLSKYSSIHRLKTPKNFEEIFVNQSYLALYENDWKSLRKKMLVEQLINGPHSWNMTIMALEHKNKIKLILYDIFFFFNFQGILSIRTVQKQHRMQSFSWCVRLHWLRYGSITENWKLDTVLSTDKIRIGLNVIKKRIFQPKSLN